MIDIKKIADEAEMIISGYAFTKFELGYKVLNLNNIEKAVVFSENGEVLETSMDDIEISIVKEIFDKDKKYM